MTWDDALYGFMQKHQFDMGQHHFEAMYDYPWDGFSIPGLWSYRGFIWAKYEGAYPTPEEVGLAADHDFFNPDVVCVVERRKYGGKLVSREQWHHGKKMRPGHRLWRDL